MHLVNQRGPISSQKALSSGIHSSRTSSGRNSKKKLNGCLFIFLSKCCAPEGRTGVARSYLSIAAGPELQPRAHVFGCVLCRRLARLLFQFAACAADEYAES